MGTVVMAVKLLFVRLRGISGRCAGMTGGKSQRAA